MAQQSETRSIFGGWKGTFSESQWGAVYSSTFTSDSNAYLMKKRFVAAVQPPNPTRDYVTPRPYNWTKETTTSGMGTESSWNYTYKNAGVERWSRRRSSGIVVSDMVYGTPPTLDRVAIYNNALEKFYSKIQASDGVNVAVDLAEMPSTIRMVTSYCQDLMRFRKRLLKELTGPTALAKAKHRLKQWRKPNVKRLRRDYTVIMDRYTLYNFDEFAASQWLKFTLGLKPTLSTLDALAKLAPKIADVVHTVTGTSQGLISGSVQQWSAGNTASAAQHDVLCNVRITGKYSVGDVQAAALHSVAPVSPISTAWELIPLSFVADYFVNVGQYLNLMDAAHARGLTFRGGYTRYYDQNVTHLRYAESSGTSISGSALLATGVWTRKSYSRALTSSFPRPGRPSVRLNLNGDKITNIGALLDQFVRRLVR